MATSREFDWGAFDARIRKLEALADEVRAFTRAGTYAEVARATARLHDALEALDRAAPRAAGNGTPAGPREGAADFGMVADLLRRKRVYEALLRAGQKAVELGDGAP